MKMIAKKETEVTIEAVITRADGTKENLGVICSTKIPWFKKLLRKVNKIG